MESQNNLDKTLIEAYRQQTAPSVLHHAVVDQFLAQRARRDPWPSWHTGVVASIAVCLIFVVILFNDKAIPTNQSQSSIRMAISSAPIRSLPSLSSFSLGSSYSVPSINPLTLPNLPDLAGQYRRAVNLKNKIL